MAVLRNLRAQVDSDSTVIAFVFSVIAASCAVVVYGVLWP